ncbi:MFS general substrate transporter [Cylindrobasidium torrendii FP15055 ss-10]|uniref:MFS general substrate transporter n=1 Tax=Cylindrobasidium torrendii FP15055 ss-10 TaxID=1314674 RepID=A0A0D7B5C3_9AGAR|nr:MFS general substrate transporter [Cylindrobasidium torrendii FP15055 ss-10]
MALSKPEAIELEARPPSSASQFAPEPSGTASEPASASSTTTSIVNESSLAPVDGGRAAWSFLVAAFFVEAIVWGFPSAFGIFLDYYLNDPKYSSQPGAATLLPIIGPASSGVIYCSGLLIQPFMLRYPYHRRTSMWIGVFFCFASLFGASYATKIEALVCLQGVLYAIGGSLLYTPCISYVSEWFVERRGTANGIIFAGTAVGGLFLPLTIPRLIAKFGLTITLRALAIGILLLLVPLIPLVRPRIPDSRTQMRAPAPVSREWMRHSSLWLALMANTLQGFGYFVPVVWLPTFAREVGIDSSKSALAVALLNGASVVGRLSMGYLSDTVEPWSLAIGTLFSTSIATFIIWGLLSKTFAGLVAYGIVYGMLAGGWSSSWSGFVRPVAKDDARLVSTLFTYFLFSRGIGNILSTPISSALIRKAASTKANFPVNGKYENMIVYVGTCFAGAASVCVVGFVMSFRKRGGQASGGVH